MTSSFGVQTVINIYHVHTDLNKICLNQTVVTTASKHYKFAVNSLLRRVLVIPNVTETFYYPRRVHHSKSGRQTRLHLVFKS